MRKILSIIAILFISFTGNFASYADENLEVRETELNLFTGMFDFSDGKQKAGLLGLQHQTENLYRNTILGKLSPITGGFLTEKNAFYLYTGAQAEYDFGLITSSFNKKPLPKYKFIY